MMDAGTAKNAKGGQETAMTAIPVITVRVTRQRVALMMVMIFLGLDYLEPTTAAPTTTKSRPAQKAIGTHANCASVSLPIGS